MTEGRVQSAEVLLPCTNLNDTLSFFTDKLGFRIDSIFPADDPAAAQISGYGLRLYLQRGAHDDDGVLRLLCDTPSDTAGKLTAPNGTRVEFVDSDPPLSLPPAHQEFVISRGGDTAAWGTGRAGMQYRDLVPARQGGHLIASHIRIPGAGPVPDYVHFHKIRFQVIYCYKGWARLVYQDQGEPFLFRPGDCVLQAPEIRHRVLESGDDLEVIEIGSPAEHMTCVDHTLTLPTDTINSESQFGGQSFIHHRAAEATWGEWRLAGFKARDTGVGHASGGVGGVRVIRPASAPETRPAQHDADTLLLFILAGSLQLESDGVDPLTVGDSALLPRGKAYRLAECTSDLELLEVSMPDDFETTLLD